VLDNKREKKGIKLVPYTSYNTRFLVLNISTLRINTSKTTLSCH